MSAEPHDSGEGTAFARWLDAPGTAPDDVEADVLEAVYALRPDLAPAPRVTADDILALVSAGPLVGDAGSEVLAGPPSTEAPAEVVSLADRRQSRGRLAGMGGWSGVGLAVAAVATFLLVSVPAMQDRSAEPMPAAAEEQRAAPAATAPPPAEEPEAAAEPPRPPAARSRPKAAPRPAPSPAPPREDAAYDMEGAPIPTRDLIPELEDRAAGQAEGGESLDAMRADINAPSTPDAWKAQVSAGDVDRVSALLDAAENAARSGDHRQAGDIASRGIAPPAAAAHAAAWSASSHYLASGDRTAAADAARKGLAISGTSPDFPRLALRYGDLVRTSDPAEAARWYDAAR